MPTLSEELEEIRIAERELAARKRDVYRRSLEAPESEKVMADVWVKGLANPEGLSARLDEASRRPLGWPVDTISWAGCTDAIKWRRGHGEVVFVSVRPCAEEFGNKTYIGLLLGDGALSVTASFNAESRVLNVNVASYNPLIFIPELGTCVFGCGSWWGEIESEDDLRKITDADIDSVWYVQALKALGRNVEGTAA